MKYRISARDYLSRAREFCDSSSCRNLFYAAFELRCGIESRLQEYVEAQRDFDKARKLDWQIPKLAKTLEGFGSQDRIVEVSILGERLFYTPVTKELRNRGERLGGLLHALRDYSVLTESWWETNWEFVRDTVRELQVATTGVLLCPPLVHRATGRVRLVAEHGDGERRIADLVKRATSGTQGEMEIRYLRELPSDA